MSIGYDAAYALLREAQEKCDEADRAADAADSVSCDAFLKSAYYAVYSAARTGNMLFEASHEGVADEWSGYGPQGGRFTWAKDRLETFSRILLKQYFMEGGFPSGDVETCRKWATDVKEYIDALAAESAVFGSVRQASDMWAAGTMDARVRGESVAGQVIEGTEEHVFYDPRDFV